MGTEVFWEKRSNRCSQSTWICAGFSLGKIFMKCLENSAAEANHWLCGFDRNTVVLLQHSEYFSCFHFELRNFSWLSLL